MISKSKSSSAKYFLRCTDFTVSNEKFDLLRDETLDMLITTPQPDLENIGKYYESDLYISHTDSKKSLLDRVYQFVKSFTILKKVKLINLEVTAKNNVKSILDIGCGTGDFLYACKSENWKIFGVEPNKKAKAISEEKLKTDIVNDISEVEGQTFDCITMWHVLEHVPDLKNYINALSKLLNSSGTLIVAVPNFKSYDAIYYGSFWAAYDVPRHLWHFSKTSIKNLFKKENMKVVKMLPMKFDSYYVSLLSEKYKSGNYNLIRSFFIGLRSNLSARKTKEYSSIIYIIKNL